MKRRPFVSPISRRIKNLHLVNSFYSHLFFFLLISFIKASCNESIFIDYSLSCQWWQQHEETKKILSNDSPSFREGQLKGKSCQCGFHFTAPPHKRKRKVALNTHLEPKEMKKFRFWSFSNMNVKHIIIIIIIIFIIRLICLVHTSLYMNTIFTRMKELSKQTI